MALPIEKQVAQAFADYKKHTDGIYKSSTLAKYQRMRDALKDGDLKSAKKLGKQVHNEVIDQGEKQMRHADRQEERADKVSQTGSRGGTFYVNAAGNKVYLKK